MDNRAKIIIGAENQAGAGINHAEKDLRKLGTAAERFGRQTKKSFREATVSSNSFSGSVQQLHTRIVGLQGVLLGLGVGAGIYKSLDVFATLDKGLIGIQKTTNMTDRQMQAMGASIRQLALEVPVATEGLLEIAEAAGQLGVTGVKDVTLFTETLAKMQIASDVVGAEGAKSLARLLNTAGEATEGVKILGSVIVALGNQTAASEAEIVHMASEVGRGTAAFNVSSAAAAAYGAALKAMGARAEISGSAITRSMIEIEKAIIAEGEKFLYLQEVTGMAGETIKRVFQEDSTKVFNAFIRGAHDMTESGESAITILGKFGLTGTEIIKGLTPLIKNVEQLDKAFRIANKEVKNATALDEEAIRASKSFSAQMQLTKNAIDEIAAGIGKGLAPAIVEVTKDFRDWVETNQDFINQELPDKIKGIGEQLKGVASSLSSIVDIYNGLPAGVVGAAGTGLVVRIISGSTPLGVLVGSLMLLNAQLVRVDMNLGAIGRKWQEFDAYNQNIWDVFTGKRDWSTGAIKNIEDLATAFIELHTAQGSIWVERGDMDAYLNNLDEIDGATSSLAGNTKGLGNSVEDASNKIKTANRELEEYYKELNKANTAMDRVTLAALPEHERGLEQIERRYKGLHAALNEWGELAGKTMPEIAQLHTDLGLSMDAEIGDYIKSHEIGTDTIYDTWAHMYERLQDITADWIYDMKVDFDSIVDLFKRSVAEMISAWIWGQQNMQFASSGQGGFSLGGMFGGMFGGGGGGGMTGQTAARAAMMAGHGPVSEEWATAQGFRNTMQGASTAWSLNSAYGAYGAAGGGWAGAKAGIGSLFGYGGGVTAAPAATWSSVGGFPAATVGAGAGAGGISGAIKSIFSSIPISYYILAGYLAGDYLTKQNVKHGYGSIEGGPQGYGPYQPINPLYGGRYGDIDYRIGSSGVDPAQTWASGVLGGGPTAGDYFAYHVDQGNWGDAFKTAPFVADQWANPFGPQFWTNVMGMPDWADPMKILGISNKKRSYYGKSFEFGEYSPEAGWVDPLGEVYRDKRKGEKAFGGSGESMAQTGLDLINSLDSLFKNLLGTFGENQKNLFTTKMIDLAALGLSFDFYISAEDKGEFQDDWRKSWAAMAEGLVDPIMDIGADMLSQALDSTVSDATAWNYFSDEMREHLKTGLEDSLADLKVDWSAATNQESFEAAFEQMGVATENIQGILDYFTQVGDIMDQVSEAMSMSEFSEPARAAIQSLKSINVQFDEFANVLLSLGVDLEKYTDLETSRHLAITAEVRAMSDAAMSGEDLALSLKYMREEMEVAGHTARDIAGAMDAAFAGIMESIEDIERRHEDYGKTALELLLEKHPEWGDVSTYDQWAETNQMFRDMFEALRYDYGKPYDFEEWLREQQGIDADTLQEWHNLGLELEKLFEKMSDETAGSDLIDVLSDKTEAELDTTKELIKVMKEFRDFQVKLTSELFGITGQGGMALSPEQWKVVMADAFKDQVPGNAGLDLDIDLIRNLMGLGQDYLNSMKMQFTSQYDWIVFVSQFLKDIDHIMMRLGSAGGPGRKTFGYDMDRYFYEPGRGLTDTGLPRFEHYATGGWHGGGWGVFGEAGPELVYAPPARIYSNNDTNKILNSGEDVAGEVRQLKAEIKEVTSNTKRQLEIIRGWNWDGMPPERT